MAATTTPKRKKFKPKRKYQPKPIEKPITTKKEEYVSGYKELQSLWKKKDKELALVGRLAYWTYWLSKLAEKSESSNGSRRSELFALKKNGLLLLAQSDYVQIKKYVPPIHRKICHKHRAFMGSKEMKPSEYLKAYSLKVSSCPKCLEGEEFHYALYSLAVLDGKKDEENRKLLFAMSCPYPVIKEEFPPLDLVESLEKYYGNETISIAVGALARNVNVGEFTEEFIIKYFTKNYEGLKEHYQKNSKNKKI